MEKKKMKSNRQSMFADIVVSPAGEVQPREPRSHYMKLLYPNGVTLILPSGIPTAVLMEYVKSYQS